MPHVCVCWLARSFALAEAHASSETTPNATAGTALAGPGTAARFLCAAPMALLWIAITHLVRAAQSFDYMSHAACVMACPDFAWLRAKRSGAKRVGD